MKSWSDSPAQPNKPTVFKGWWCSGKENAWQYRRPKRLRFDSWIEKIPWNRKGPPGPVCLENSMDRGAWWATVHGVAKNQTQQHLTHTHTSTCRHNFGLKIGLWWIFMTIKIEHLKYLKSEQKRVRNSMISSWAFLPTSWPQGGNEQCIPSPYSSGIREVGWVKGNLYWLNICRKPRLAKRTSDKCFYFPCWNGIKKFNWMNS